MGLRWMVLSASFIIDLLEIIFLLLLVFLICREGFKLFEGGC